MKIEEHLSEESKDLLIEEFIRKNAGYFILCSS